MRMRAWARGSAGHAADHPTVSYVVPRRGEFSWRNRPGSTTVPGNKSMPPAKADRMETMTMNWTRRSILSGAAVMGSTLIVKPLQAAEYRFSQYHNQAASGPLHKNLTAMWEAVRTETNGRVETTVYPENNK